MRYRPRTAAPEEFQYSERAAIDGTPVSAIVGDDPVEFTENFAESYGGKRWIDKERTKLIAAVDEAIGKEGRS